MPEINNFDVKISVILNWLEKHMAFAIDKSLVLIDNVWIIVWMHQLRICKIMTLSIDHKNLVVNY